MAYLLDSDVFIQASNLHYQSDFCPAFWDWIDREHKAGVIISIDRVLDEISEGLYGSLIGWAQARQSLFVKSADLPTMKSLQQVGLWASKNFDEAGYDKFFKGADFVLVGYAHAHKHILVTQETPGKGVGGKKVKIPDACDAFGVKWMNTFDLLAKEKPSFVLV